MKMQTYTVSVILCLYTFPHEFRAEVQSKLHLDQDYPCDVVGSWNTWYGDQDQAGKWQRRWCITTLSRNPNRLLSNMIC